MKRFAKKQDPLSRLNRGIERQRKDDISVGRGGTAGNPDASGGVAWAPIIFVHPQIADAFVSPPSIGLDAASGMLVANGVLNFKKDYLWPGPKATARVDLNWAAVPLTAAGFTARLPAIAYSGTAMASYGYTEILGDPADKTKMWIECSFNGGAAFWGPGPRPFGTFVVISGAGRAVAY